MPDRSGTRDKTTSCLAFNNIMPFDINYSVQGDEIRPGIM